MKLFQILVYLSFTVLQCSGKHDDIQKLLEDYTKQNHQIENVVIHLIKNNSEYFNLTKSLINMRYLQCLTVY